MTSADLQYLFGIQRSEPDCMTRLVSERDQPHIRSPRETAAPISRLRRSGLRKTRPFFDRQHTQNQPVVTERFYGNAL